MKEIILKFEYHSDLIAVPNNIEKNIKKIRKQFDKWLYDKSNDHGYWIYINGQKKAVSYGTEAFVRYINEHHLAENEEKAYVIDSELQSAPTSCAITLFF